MLVVIFSLLVMVTCWGWVGRHLYKKIFEFTLCFDDLNKQICFQDIKSSKTIKYKLPGRCYGFGLVRAGVVSGCGCAGWREGGAAGRREPRTLCRWVLACDTSTSGPHAGAL